MPLRIDVVLIRRKRGKKPPPQAERHMSKLAARLRRYTLLEFKGPTDKLERGDLEQFLGCIHLFRAQQRLSIPLNEMSVVILAPRLTRAFRADLNEMHMTIAASEPGVHELRGGAFSMWLLETDHAGEDPLLTLMSRIFLRNPRRIIDQWRGGENAMLAIYTAQEIQQFQQQGEPFVLLHRDTEIMSKVSEELLEAQISLIGSMSLEDLKRVFCDKSVQELIHELPDEILLEALGNQKLDRLQKMRHKKQS